MNYAGSERQQAEELLALGIRQTPKTLLCWRADGAGELDARIHSVGGAAGLPGSPK